MLVVLLTYLGTMGFFIASAILLDDIGLDTGHAECNAGIMICSSLDFTVSSPFSADNDRRLDRCLLQQVGEYALYILP